MLQKLEDAVRTAMQDPAIIKRLEEIDVQPVFVNSRDTRKWLEDDVRKSTMIIRDAGPGAAMSALPSRTWRTATSAWSR